MHAARFSIFFPQVSNYPPPPQADLTVHPDDAGVLKFRAKLPAKYGVSGTRQERVASTRLILRRKQARKRNERNKNFPIFAISLSRRTCHLLRASYIVTFVEKTTTSKKEIVTSQLLRNEYLPSRPSIMKQKRVGLTCAIYVRFTAQLGIPCHKSRGRWGKTGGGQDMYVFLRQNLAGYKVRMLFYTF